MLHHHIKGLTTKNHLACVVRYEYQRIYLDRWVGLSVYILFILL